MQYIGVSLSSWVDNSLALPIGRMALVNRNKRVKAYVFCQLVTIHGFTCICKLKCYLVSLCGYYTDDKIL